MPRALRRLARRLTCHAVLLGVPGLVVAPCLRGQTALRALTAPAAQQLIAAKRDSLRPASGVVPFEAAQILIDSVDARGAWGGCGEQLGGDLPLVAHEPDEIAAIQLGRAGWTVARRVDDSVHPSESWCRIELGPRALEVLRTGAVLGTDPRARHGGAPWFATVRPPDRGRPGLVYVRYTRMDDIAVSRIEFLPGGQHARAHVRWQNRPLPGVDAAAIEPRRRGPQQASLLFVRHADGWRLDPEQLGIVRP